jgi:hypothetical protein
MISSSITGHAAAAFQQSIRMADYFSEVRPLMISSGSTVFLKICRVGRWIFPHGLIDGVVNRLEGFRKSGG